MGLNSPFFAAMHRAHDSIWRPPDDPRVERKSYCLPLPPPLLPTLRREVVGVSSPVVVVQPAIESNAAASDPARSIWSSRRRSEVGMDIANEVAGALRVGRIFIFNSRDSFPAYVQSRAREKRLPGMGTLHQILLPRE